ncbi:MAG: YkgJ family cysteine cluster protein [Syntrophomonadaceae bacterium]|nr:YkgJ family cysteine cluster protein [Syntrophomonadaceae bacterium]
MMAGNDKVCVGIEPGQNAIRLEVNDASASLQELLDAWQPLCDDAGISKTYAAGHFAPCRACEQNCCLSADISPDLISLRRLAQGLDMSIAGFVAEYCRPDLLEHGLMKVRSQPCVFLHSNICAVYPRRTLLCRFYICAEMAGPTQELIYRISLLGAAAAHRYAREQGIIPAPVPHGLGGFDRAFLQLMEEHMAHAALDYFLQAENYSQIPLAIVLE